MIMRRLLVALVAALALRRAGLASRQARPAAPAPIRRTRS